MLAVYIFIYLKAIHIKWQRGDGSVCWEYKCVYYVAAYDGGDRGRNGGVVGVLGEECRSCGCIRVRNRVVA